MNTVHFADCTGFMADKPDKYYDLAICDPPYGIGVTKMGLGRGGGLYREPRAYKQGTWDHKAPSLNDFADCELAWTSFKTAVRQFSFRWLGMLQGNMKNKEKRIHPAQKPIALYKWLLQNYAKPGQTIFDSHVGSGSIRIACHDLGFDFEGCEIDPDYWQAQEDRYNNHILQGGLFGKEEIQELVYRGNR